MRRRRPASPAVPEQIVGRLRARGRGAVLAALALAAACGRCGERSAPERHLPAGSAAVVVPRLGDAAEKFAALAGTLQKFPIAAGIAEQREAIAAQLGFDPLDREGQASFGLDPRGGLALARTPTGWLAVLPVGDAARLGDGLARIARDRLAAGARGTASVDGVAVTVARGAADPALAWTIAGRLALVAPGKDGPARVAAAARLPPADSLAESAAWKAARGALPSRPAAILFSPPGAWPATALAPLRDGAALALAPAAESVEATAAIVLPPQRLEAWRALAAGAVSGEEADFARLPADAFLAARFAGDPVALGERLLWTLPADARAAIAAAGLDPKELLAPLAPGAAAAASLAPTFDFTAFSRARRGGASADPFRFVHLTAVLRVGDEAAARRALDALGAAAPRLGLVPRAEADALALSRGEATVRLALRGDRLHVAAGAGRLEELERIAADGAKRFAPPTASARDAAKGGIAAALAAPGALVASARALPESAFGAGPDKYVMRSVADRVLDPASRLEAAALRVDLGDGAARVVLRVEIRPGAAVGP